MTIVRQTSPNTGMECPIIIPLSSIELGGTPENIGNKKSRSKRAKPNLVESEKPSKKKIKLSTPTSNPPTKIKKSINIDSVVQTMTNKIFTDSKPKKSQRKNKVMIETTNLTPAKIKSAAVVGSDPSDPQESSMVPQTSGIKKMPIQRRPKTKLKSKDDAGGVACRTRKSRRLLYRLNRCDASKNVHIIMPRRKVNRGVRKRWKFWKRLRASAQRRIKTRNFQLHETPFGFGRVVELINKGDTIDRDNEFIKVIFLGSLDLAPSYCHPVPNDSVGSLRAICIRELINQKKKEQLQAIQQVQEFESEEEWLDFPDNSATLQIDSSIDGMNGECNNNNLVQCNLKDCVQKILECGNKINFSGPVPPEVQELLCAPSVDPTIVAPLKSESSQDEEWLDWEESLSRSISSFHNGSNSSNRNTNDQLKAIAAVRWYINPRSIKNRLGMEGSKTKPCTGNSDISVSALKI